MKPNQKIAPDDDEVVHRGLCIRAEQRVRLRIDAEVRIEHVALLVAVLDEVAVTLIVERRIAHHSQIVCRCDRYFG